MTALSFTSLISDSSGEGSRAGGRGRKGKNQTARGLSKTRNLDNPQLSRCRLSISCIPSILPVARLSWRLRNAVFVLFKKEKEHLHIYVCTYIDKIGKRHKAIVRVCFWDVLGI